MFPDFIKYVDKYFIKKPRFRRFVNNLIVPKGETNIELAGAIIRINNQREHGYFRSAKMSRTSSFFRDELYNLISLAALLEKGDTFIDIGANVGVYSCILSKLSPIKKVQYYAFEANPDTFKRLEYNCKQYGITSQNVAISDQCGSLTFVEGAVSHVFTTIDRSNSYNIKTEAVQVEAKTLDSLEINGKRFILKIDVEGQEMNVIKGAKKMFEDGKIKAVYIDGITNDNDREDIFKLLTENGFSLFDSHTMQDAIPTTFSLIAIKSIRNN